MKSKHDKSNGSNSDRESNGKYDSKNVVSNDIDDSMSDGGDRSRSGSVNRNDRSSKDKVDHDALSIYIGNVDYSATEEELRNTFISCGEIVRVTIIKNMKTGHPKGAAFIEFTDKEGVQGAMQLNGKEVKGRPLIVTSKKPRPENRSRDPRPSYNSYDRRPPRQGPPHGYSAPYGGGRGSYGAPSRGGYFQAMPYDSRRGGHPQAPMPMSMDQARMQPRYDPYRRPEFYDPYMMQRGAPPPPPPNYYHHQEKMGNNSHNRTSQPPQRYSNPFGNRK